MGKLTLILGGARSGKSVFAERMATAMGGEHVLYVATAEAGDEEMQRRIEKHREQRPAAWQTLEVRRRVGPAILKHADGGQVVLLDCLTLLVSNRLVAADDPFSPEIQEQVKAEVADLVMCAEQLVGHLIVVSNEVGLGLVPAYPLGRAYRDLLGHANQTLAAVADEVSLLVAGIPVTVKSANADAREC